MAAKSNTAKVQGIFSKAWSIFKQNWVVVVGLVSIPLLVDILLLSTVFEEVREWGNNSAAYESITEIEVPPNFGLYVIISYILGIILSGALITALLQIMRKKQITIGQALNAGLERFWDVFSVSLVIILIVIAGLIALVVPGIIAGFFLMFAVHARIDKNLTVSQSLKLSYAKVSNNWIQMLLIILGFIGITVAVDVLNRIVTNTFSDFGVNIWYTLTSIPMGAYISIVFTKAYLDFKPKKEIKLTP